MRGRALTLAAWVLGALALALALHQGWTTTLRTEGIPSYDAADYLNRALEVLRPGSGWTPVLEADVHPPGYPLALAAWMGLAGRSFLAAAQLSLLLTVASLALLPVLGGLVDGRRGALAGLAAAVATSMGIEHQRLLAAPMTEPLALLAALLCLVLAARALERRAWTWDLAVGLALLGASLVRYNLGPMLLVPLVLVQGGRALLRPREALRWSLALWVLPALTVFGAWWLLEPRLVDAVRTFSVNVNTGIRTWTWENLVWLPAAYARDYPGLVPAAVGAGAAFAATCAWALARGGAALRLLVLFAALGIAAVWLHPFKLSRALHPLVPVAYLVGALGVARLATWRRGWVRAVSLAGLLALGAWWFLAARAALAEPEAHGRLELAAVPDLEEDLDALVQHAAGRSWVTISGEHLLVATVAVETLVRLESPAAEVVSEHKPPDWCGPPGTSEHPDCVLSPGSRRLLATEGRDWLVISVEKETPTGPGRRHWSQRNAAVLGAAAREQGVPALAEVHSGRRRVRVTAWGRP